MKVIVSFFGVVLFLLAAALPIGCQYTITNGPEWLRDCPEKRLVETQPPPEVTLAISKNGGDAVRFTTGILFVITVAAAVSCLVVVSDDKK